MKFFQKRAVAAVVLILAIVAGVVIGQAKKPDTGGQASTAIVGSYTYVYDYAGVLTDETMEHIDAMNASLFAQTGAQILVSVVNSTGGADIMDYASDLGNSYGVGSAERNNGVVMLLALDNISQSGLMGDYCVVVGTGLESHADDFMSLQSYYLENDFAAGEYDAGVKATFDAFIAWFADFYGVTIREGYIPAVRETYSSGSGYYYTETHGYVAPAFGSLVSGVVVLLVVLLVLWVILDGMRYSRYRRRYLRPGMGRPTVLYYPIFWGRPQRPQATPSSKTAKATAPAALRRNIRRGRLRRQPGRHVRRRLLRECQRVPGQPRRRDLPGQRRPSRRLWRRLLPQRRGETRRLFPRRAPVRDRYNGACMPFEKQEDPPEFRDDPPAFALEEVLLLRCGSADGEHFAGLKGFLAAIGRLGYSGAVVDRQVRRVCAGTDVVRKRLHLSQKSGVPAGHEVRIVLLPRTMLIHDLQQVPGAHGGDAQRAVGSDDFRLYIAACCMGAVGKEKAHGAVFALDHGGGIVCVMQFPTEVELKDTTDGPDVTDVRAGEPADQIQIVDAHVQELAARVGEEFQCGFNGAAGILGAGADQHHFADFTGVHTALGLSIGGVKPAHEAQLEHQFRMGLNNLFSFLALSHIGAQRLFTENVLAVLHGNFDLLHMKKRGGDDDDAVQLRIGAHGGKIGVSMRNAQFLCHRPETGGIHVTDGVEDAAGNGCG